MIFLQELPYFNACIQESLRIIPPVFLLIRTCVKDCTINGIYFKKGTIIYIPIHASHLQEDYFPEPHEFKPERFFKDNLASIPEYALRTFGCGPRTCFGKRFAIREIKAAAAEILLQIKVSATDDSPNLKMTKGDLFFLHTNEVLVNIEERK